MVLSEIPHNSVRRPAAAKSAYMKSIRKGVGQQPNQPLRDSRRTAGASRVRLRSRIRKQAALTFGREGQTRAHVVVKQLREVLKELLLGRTTGKIRQHVAHGDPSPTHCWLSEADVRIDDDAVEEIGHNHQCTVKPLPRQGIRGVNSPPLCFEMNCEEQVEVKASESLARCSVPNTLRPIGL